MHLRSLFIRSFFNVFIVDGLIRPRVLALNNFSFPHKKRNIFYLVVSHSQNNKQPFSALPPHTSIFQPQRNTNTAGV